VPPRFAYWTILVGGLPTAFRATEREELLPTFKRLLEKHPDAVMRWFSRGQLWESPDAARAALIDARRAEHPPRGRDWRPGGAHRDPRQKYIDAKKARNVDRRKQRFERRQNDDPSKGPTERPPGSRPDGPSGWKNRPDRPSGPKPEGRREWKDRPDRPSGPKPEGRREWKDRPLGPRPPGKPAGGRGPDRPAGPRGPRGPKR
jgi:hypothetical protein